MSIEVRDYVYSCACNWVPRPLFWRAYMSVLVQKIDASFLHAAKEKRKHTVRSGSIEFKTRQLMHIGDAYRVRSRMDRTSESSL